MSKQKNKGNKEARKPKAGKSAKASSKPALDNLAAPGGAPSRGA